jgi:hypothetical protein
LICAAVLYAILRGFAADDVRHNPDYLSFYMVMGAAWVGTSTGAFAFFSLSARDDVVERSNPAAAAALFGALLGTTLAFAGGNIGNGPGWWVVLFCATLATLTLLAAWCLLAHLGGLAERITVERDLAGGIRAAGFFIGGGLIVGRAVAGDWHSSLATLLDFGRFAWPVAILVIAAVQTEKALHSGVEPREADPMLSGCVPATAYVALGLAANVLANWWA